MGQHMPKVSVVVPLYNKRRYIGRALESVLSQTMGDLEVVVVDDGSTDGGADAAAALGDERVRLVRQDNRGPGAARNRGVEASCGRYLAFLDADDEYLPEYLGASTKMLDANDDCVASVSGHYRGLNKLDARSLWPRLSLSEGRVRIPPGSPLEALRSQVNMMATCSVVCRREAFTRHGGFYAARGCTWGEDSYLWLQLLMNYPLCRDLRPLSWYHYEVGELFANRNGACPPEPAVLRPEPLRLACPGEYRSLLDSYLGYLAAEAARRMVRAGAPAQAVDEVLALHPAARELGMAYCRLQRARAMGSVYRILRRMPRLHKAARKARRWLWV